jgi:hypothetical protein
LEGLRLQALAFARFHGKHRVQELEPDYLQTFDHSIGCNKNRAVTPPKKTGALVVALDLKCVDNQA